MIEKSVKLYIESDLDFTFVGSSSGNLNLSQVTVFL